jgi:DNA-binding response OmpR family regulator
MLLLLNTNTRKDQPDRLMQGKKILIVEDDKHISKLVKYNLEKTGLECSVVVTGEDALNALDSQAVDLIVLDVMLPKMDGFEVCKRIRQNSQWSSIPIIMLTARGEEVDRIVGLELGADDYIVKPFSPRELMLRIKAILRRKQTSPSESPKDILEIGILRIDVPRHKVTVNDKEISLTAMEFKLLMTLASRQGRVQSRDRLLTDVWEMNTEVTTRTIDTHVKRLRQKLGKVGRYIETIRGHGYRFSEDAV